MAQERRLGLVFSGGGAKGAFGVGVLRRLVEELPTLTWHVVSGTSTGGLIAPFASIGATDRTALDDLERLYVTSRQADIVSSNLTPGQLLKGLPMGVYDPRPLAGRIDESLPDARRRQLLDGAVTTIVNCVNLQTGELALWTQRANVARLRAWFREHGSRGGVGAHFFPEHRLTEALLASAAIPGAIEPQEFRRTGAGAPCASLPRQQIVDGGVIDIAPLRSAIAAGATDLLVVLMSPRVPAPVCRRAEHFVDVALRAVDLLTDEIARNDVEVARSTTDLCGLADVLLEHEAELPQVVRDRLAARDGALRTRLASLRGRRPLNVHVIEPGHPLGDTLDFDSKVASGWPADPSGPKKVGIMAARLRAGVRAARAALREDAALAAMLRAFSA